MLLLWLLFRLRSAAEQPSFSTSVDEKDRVACCRRALSRESEMCHLAEGDVCLHRKSLGGNCSNTRLSYLAKIAGLPRIEVHGKRARSEKQVNTYQLMYAFKNKLSYVSQVQL
jgi:hypothetical protein